MSTSIEPSPENDAPLEHFALPRKIIREVRACASTAADQPAGDIFYLWLQMTVGTPAVAVAREQWLNVIDEAASVGVNWLVISMGDGVANMEVTEAMCRWAQDTHKMTVCLHTTMSAPEPTLRTMVCSLPKKETYLLVEPPFDAAFAELKTAGVQVALASPEAPEAHSACDYPCKMVYVDACGSLYTCGLVAGEREFFLGSVFSGSLEHIVHHPELPHSVDALDTRPKDGCSGCPPLVAKYLCRH